MPLSLMDRNKSQEVPKIEVPRKHSLFVYFVYNTLILGVLP